METKHSVVIRYDGEKKVFTVELFVGVKNQGYVSCLDFIVDEVEAFNNETLGEIEVVDSEG